MKTFNTEAICIPEQNYMVDLSERLVTTKKLIDEHKYFNRGRQYGKTTFLYMLKNYIIQEYTVISISFEAADDLFVDRTAFVRGFIRKTARELKRGGLSESVLADWSREIPEDLCWEELGERITRLCCEAEKPVVLMIDEVDKSSDNSIFLSFLGLLRDKYIERQKSGEETFNSVILSGVYDVKNLRIKIRPEEDHKRNSPWNIAAPFEVDMDFSEKDIEGMLSEYRDAQCADMDIQMISKEIHDYTGGYPFLVSLICKLVDESGEKWDLKTIRAAEKKMLSMKLPLFESLINYLAEYPKIELLIRRILLEGDEVADNPDEPGFEMAKMFGFLKSKDGLLCIANRAFETRLYNYFTASPEMQKEELFRRGSEDKNRYIDNGMLDMDKVVDGFVRAFNNIYPDRREKFIEEEGRRFFLLFLKPIINGAGNYYIEAETRNRSRTDIIVDYHGRQYVIELKIWRGEAYNTRGEKQLAEYLDHYHVDKGWMVSFCFNKTKIIGTKEIKVGNKTIFEGVV